MQQPRLDYNESIRRLQELGWLDRDENPPLPGGVPQPDDDEPLGLSFFRTFVGDSADLGDLTIPRTFFGRSEIKDVSFQNTDLTESNLQWNDFIDVDFTGAVLAVLTCGRRSTAVLILRERTCAAPTCGAARSSNACSQMR